jgi:type IV secretion system protein VirD4
MGRSLGSIRTGFRLGRALSSWWGRARDQANVEAKQEQVTRAHQAILASPPPLHGSAEWPSPADVRAAGYVTDAFEAPPNGAGLRVGAVTDKLSPGAAIGGLLEWNEDGHILTVAPTRSGKATSLIVPNLLSYRGSTVVLDPKGELFELTSAWRRAHVGPVHRIALFDREDRRAAGYPRHSFNPLLAVRTIGDARAVASLLLPRDAKAQDFFNKDAVAFLTAAILYLKDAAPPKAQTIPELRRMTSLPLQDFRAMIRRMQDSPIQEVRSGANVVSFKSSDRGLPNLIETLNADLSLWTEPDIVHAVSGTNVNFEEIKEHPATIYVTVPFDRLKPFAPFIKVLLRTALDAMIQNPALPAIPVLFVLDEFLALEDATELIDAIRTHAGAGVRLWFILQDLGALKKTYGDGGEAVFNTALKVWFGTNDHLTAERLSKELGTATVAHEKISFTVSQSTSRSDPFSLPNRTSGTSMQRQVDLLGRALLTPDEVRTRLAAVLSDKTRLAIAQTGPFVRIAVRLIPYFRLPWCRERAGCVVDVVPSSAVAQHLKDIRS